MTTASVSDEHRAGPVRHDADRHHELPAPWWLVRDTWTVTKRNLRHFVRQPRLLVFSTIQPIMFVVLFAYVSRVAVLAGRTFADLVRSLSVVLLMVAVGYAIGFRFTEGPVSAVGAVLVVGLFGYVVGWLFTYLALVVPGAEAAQTAGFVLVFPLVFASSIFVPVETMPSWLQGFAANSPVSFAADATRALSIGGPVARPLLFTLGWSAIILAVAVPASVRRYRRMS